MRTRTHERARWRFCSGSRRMLNPKSSEAVVELVLAELRKFDQDAVIVCGSGVDGDSACTLVGASTHAQFS